MNETYQTMRDIGAKYGLSSHKVGKILTEAGLRDNGRPSDRAFKDGWVEQRWAVDLPNYIWAWDAEKVSEMLEALGHASVITQ